MFVEIRRAHVAEARAVADVWLRSRVASIPHIPPPVHSDDEVRGYFERVVLPEREVWVAEVDRVVLGLLALDGDCIEQLYVDPQHCGSGIGSRLITIAKQERPDGLCLWTFEANVGARRFYERHGFIATDSTPGDNEEGAPDVRYEWRPDGPDLRPAPTARCVILHAGPEGMGQSGEVDIAGAAPLDLRAAVDSERRALLEVLAELGPEDWLRPTAAGHWCVRDVALHLLDDDLGWLSRGRDGDLASLIPMNVPYREFVRALNAKNQRWVDAAQGLSPRVVRELLAWSGEQVADYYDGLDAAGTTEVIWAGGEVPQWLGVGRDFTERWVHQQQIREAVGIPGDHSRQLPIVLAVFIWAFPNQFTPAAEVGTTVDITLGEAQWHLVRRDDVWKLNQGADRDRVAAIEMDADTAWRQLTGAAVRDGAVRISGPAHLTERLLAVRGIIV